jgi:hypothetical protein
MEGLQRKEGTGTMIIKKELMKREVAGECFLVPMGKSVYDYNGMFIMTELAAFIWDRLPQAQDEEEILQAILEEYEVEEAVARADLKAFLDKLRTMDVI